MTVSQQAPIVATFTDAPSARLAIAALDDAGFDRDKITLLVEEAGETEVSPETRASEATSELAALQVPAEDAAFYCQQLEKGRALIVVEQGLQAEKLFRLLTEQGGYQVDLPRDTKIAGTSEHSYPFAETEHAHANPRPKKPR